MTLKEHTITGSAEAVLTLDGQGIAFTLMEGQTPLLRVKFQLDDMPAFIAHLCSVVAALHPAPRPSSRPVFLPVANVALGGSDAPNTSRLVLRLAGMDLGFSMTTKTTNELAAHLQAMSQAAHTLSAPSDQPPH